MDIAMSFTFHLPCMLSTHFLPSGGSVGGGGGWVGAAAGATALAGAAGAPLSCAMAVVENRVIASVSPLVCMSSPLARSCNTNRALQMSVGYRSRALRVDQP